MAHFGSVLPVVVVDRIENDQASADLWQDAVVWFPGFQIAISAVDPAEAEILRSESQSFSGQRPGVANGVRGVFRHGAVDFDQPAASTVVKGASFIDSCHLLQGRRHDGRVEPRLDDLFAPGAVSRPRPVGWAEGVEVEWKRKWIPPTAGPELHRAFPAILQMAVLHIVSATGERKFRGAGLPLDHFAKGTDFFLMPDEQIRQIPPVAVAWREQIHVQREGAARVVGGAAVFIPHQRPGWIEFLHEAELHGVRFGIGMPDVGGQSRHARGLPFLPEKIKRVAHARSMADRGHEVDVRPNLTGAGWCADILGMNAIQKAHLKMHKAVLGVLDDNNSLWQTSTAMTSARNLLNTGINAVTALQVSQGGVTTGVTDDKATARRALAESAVVVAGAVGAYADAQGNHELYDAVDFTVADLLHGPEEDCRVHAANILTKGTENLAALVANHSLAQADLDDLEEKLEAFAELLPKPRQAKAGTKSATDQLPAALLANDRTCERQLDKLLEKFRTSQPAFYQAYKVARVIVDPATHPNPPEPPAPPTPPGP